MCARLDEERRSGEELRGGLERDREELRTKLRDATNEVRGQLAEWVTAYDISYEAC